ncbi:protein of unknown function [Nitrospira defluvii]|uniref:Uncharacterized protein n=1 Tax=Nitrospira defluvii TaxID=330214 RepID=B3U4P1_9BACT|nr:protein of unknown function [Nitrospira defluvii]CBK41201.1 protein of unknown function [Nitrospira defluvii]
MKPHRANYLIGEVAMWFGEAPMSLVVGRIGFMCTPLLSPSTSQPTDKASISLDSDRHSA